MFRFTYNWMSEKVERMFFFFNRLFTEQVKTTFIAQSLSVSKVRLL